MGELGRKRYPATGSEYLLLEEIGQGASAIVYKARCLRYNDIVAVKILDLERCNSNLDDVCREVQTTSLIDHPNVLSSHCSFVVDRFLWVVTPYMADGSFLHIMKSAYPDGFEEPVIATILRETLKAIVYLHSHGHIHRDVKAGNILVDSNGAIKLGDFGVSAGMFDTGVRQRARKTFVGTPCWMAPEVMEQLHGYDFKADIWSFAITALELAHGHAPFSKYPPIKVLLMTLQNAPPGLDYARDKRFSKAFKEMVAICLAKDPARRPSAEKLLRHSFFKRAKSAEYLTQTILTGLSPLGQRFRDLTIKDEENLAQKMMPSREKEEISQSEYNRGISGWNFNVEDLKAQAALIPDDDDYSPTSKEGTELPNSNSSSNKIQSSADINDHLQPSAPVSSKQIPVDKSVSPVALLSLTTDSLNADGCTTGVRPIILRSPIQETSTDFSRDKVMLSVNGSHKFAKETELEINKGMEVDKDEQLLKQKEIKDFRRERVEATGRCAVSGPLDPEYVFAGYGGQSEVADKDRSGCSGFDECLGSSFNKGLMSSGNITAHAIPRQYRSLNGIIGLMNPLAGHKDGLEKVNSVHRKGRFSVTSEDVDLVEDIVPSRSIPKSASAQAFPQLNLARNYSTASSCNLLSESVVPHLQNILQQSIAQKESVITLMNLLNLGEASNANFSSIPLGSKDTSQSSDVGISNSLVASASDPDKDQSQQVAELHKRVADLLEELQREKLKNVSLQCQLNAMYSKEEEKV